jgi:hypothetical protein
MKAYSIPGATSNRELDIIFEWAKTIPENGVIVELGSLFGRTATAFVEGSHPSTKIYCIDYFNTFVNTLTKMHDTPGGDFWNIGQSYDKEAEFTKNMQGYSNVIPIKLESKHNKVYPYQGELIDLLFLDCAHKNPDDIMNILYYRKFLKPGALICGHDYSDDFPDVKLNVRILEKMYDTKVILYSYGSMWAIRTAK